MKIKAVVHEAEDELCVGEALLGERSQLAQGGCVVAALVGRKALVVYGSVPWRRHVRNSIMARCVRVERR